MQQIQLQRRSKTAKNTIKIDEYESKKWDLKISYHTSPCVQFLTEILSYKLSFLLDIHLDKSFHRWHKYTPQVCLYIADIHSILCCRFLWRMSSCRNIPCPCTDLKNENRCLLVEDNVGKSWSNRRGKCFEFRKR